MAKFTAPSREAGFFVGKEEKAELTEQGTEMLVKGVERRVSPFGKGPNGENVFQYILTVDLDGDERGLSYNEGVSSRDALLASLRDYLDNAADQEPVLIKLASVKSSNGRPVNIIQVVGDEEE